MNIDRGEALRRLKSPNNLVNRLLSPLASEAPSKATPEPVAPSGSVEVPPSATNPRGRGAEVPESQRDLIARAGLLKLAKQSEIGKFFGVTEKNVSLYKNGRTGYGSGSEPSDNKKEEHTRRVSEVRDLALEKTMAALGLCGDEKLVNMEAKELGKFAKDMAGVYNSLAPKDGGDNRAPIQLLVYAPKVQDESRYKVVDV